MLRAAGAARRRLARLLPARELAQRRRRGRTSTRPISRSTTSSTSSTCCCPRAPADACRRRSSLTTRATTRSGRSRHERLPRGRRHDGSRCAADRTRHGGDRSAVPRVAAARSAPRTRWSRSTGEPTPHAVVERQRARTPIRPGSVDRTDATLDDGRFTGRIHATRPAWVMLKESYSPRWTATVDGEPVQDRRCSHRASSAFPCRRERTSWCSSTALGRHIRCCSRSACSSCSRSLWARCSGADGAATSENPELDE